MTFTTERHKTFSRKCGTVRNRASNFISVLGVKEVPLKVAIEQFSEITGMYDRKTIKAYFGTKEHRSKRSMWRRAVYAGTGTTSNKLIELVQTVSTIQGYLEKLGLVTFELRGKTWFMVVNRDAVLVPQLYESCHASKQNISLSPIRQKGIGKEHEKTEVVSCNILENNNNLQGGRDKNAPKIGYKNVFETPKPSLTPLEKSILRPEDKHLEAKEKSRDKCSFLEKERLETNSVFCSRLDQWVSSRNCRICEHNDRPLIKTIEVC